MHMENFSSATESDEYDKVVASSTYPTDRELVLVCVCVLGHELYQNNSGVCTCMIIIIVMSFTIMFVLCVYVKSVTNLIAVLRLCVKDDFVKS